MQLPPYGKMSEEYQKQLVDEPMPDWRRGEPEDVRKAAFAKWRVDMRDLLAEHIWPYYDRSRGWTGGARRTMVEATRAEVELMMQHFQGAVPRLMQKPSSVNLQVANSVHDHFYHFRLEDDLKAPLAVNYEEYDFRLTPGDLLRLRGVMDGAYDTKTGGLFYFKDQFVRPRPYQASMIFGLHEFTSRTARTAVHSSFHSGHCIEGMLIGCTLADRWLSDEEPPRQGSLSSLQQFSVDFGDRRVYAGVHYPMDNMGSWVIALNLIPDLFRNWRQVLAFAHGAIVEHSEVYKAIEANFPKNDALRPAFTFLQRQLGEAEKRANSTPQDVAVPRRPPSAERTGTAAV